jgi:predicted DNA-binding transcriptional regulator AlpA
MHAHNPPQLRERLMAVKSQAEATTPDPFSALKAIPEGEDRLLTMKQLQAVIPLSHTSIYNYCGRNGFPQFVKVGGRTFWSARAVGAYIGKLVEQAGSDAVK